MRRFGRLADEQHGAPPVAEEVDARDPRHPGRERELGGRGVDADLREGDEVVEPEDAPRRRVFEQGVEQLGRRGRVGVRAVHGFGVGPEVLRERVEAQVGDVVAHEAAGHPDRVDPTVRQRRVAVGDECGIEEAAVEPDVVPDDDRVAEELQDRRQQFTDPGRRHDHRLRDAGEQRDRRRDRDTRVHERVDPAEQLTAAQLQRADLGDRGRAPASHPSSRGRARRT